MENREEKDRVCLLSLDAMEISPGISYNSKTDKIDGFEDCGEFGRKKKAVKQAVVFMVQGVNNPFKQVVGFFLFSKNMNLTQIVPMVHECIAKLRSIGAIPKVIVCDQGGPHKGLYTKLGAPIEKPFFVHTLDGIASKIYTLYDSPHLLKSVRNNLLKHDFLIDGQRISWWTVRYVHELQKDDPKHVRLVPKLTEKHVSPNSREKMKVNLATQVFSNTMASAMSTLAALSESQAQAEGLCNASNHSRKWNQIFDIFNSDGPGPVNRQSSKQTVSDKLPLKPDNRQIELLEEELLPWIKKIKFYGRLKKRKQHQKLPKSQK